MTSETDPRYAVIIPHYNDVARLARCLEALGTQDRDGVEVVVADNNSTVSLAEIAERFPWARIVTESRPGAGLARNAGVAATTAPWLFFIDCDCLPAPDWLAEARRLAAGDPDAVTGGRVDVFDETPPPRSGAEAFETVFAFKMKRYLEEEGFLGAGNLVVSRRVFEAVGGFRGTVSEDVDWSQRAAKAGFRLAYDDALAAGHPSRSDWTALRRKWKRMTDEGFALRQSRGKARGSWLLKALLMPASILAHLPRVLGHPGLSGREKLRAAGTLVRLRLARMGWMIAQAAGRKG
jgi:GT2 family glycosyltransferase